MKKRIFYMMVFISIYLLDIGSQSGYTEKLFSQSKTKVLQTNSWLEIHRRFVLFPNMVGIQLLIAHSKIPGRWIANIAPDEKHLVIAEDLQNPKFAHDFYLYDVTGNLIGLLAKQDEKLYTATWSCNSQYLYGRSIYDIKARKLAEYDEAAKFFEWSLIGDSIVYSNDSTFQQAYIAKIWDDTVTRRKTRENDIVDLLGEAYPVALNVAQKTGTRSGSGRGYNTDMYARSLYPSPDGKRVLLQNICFPSSDLIDSPDDHCDYYIVNKNGIHIQVSKFGFEETVFTQWLDNRYLVGWFHPTIADYDEKTHYLKNTVQMVLWDTDKNRIWKTPFPRHFADDALHWRLAAAKK